MYSKTTWKDRVVDPDTGAVVQEGTFMSAEHFNNMENGIAANDSAISTINGDIDDIEETLDTGVGTTISLTINQSTFVMKLALKNSEGTTLSEQSIDLPIESMVVNAEYVETTKSLVLTLQSGSKVSVPLSALINGLVNDTRKVAGIDLKDDITVAEMKTALGVDALERNKVDKATVSNVSSTTSVNTVPECLGYAGVKMIGGKTVKDGDVLKNAPVERIVSSGKNLYNKYNNPIKSGLWASSSVVGGNSSGWYITLPITNDSYTISRLSSGHLFAGTTEIEPASGVSFVDSWTGSSSSTSVTINASSNAKYLFIGVYAGTTLPSGLQDEIQIEKSSTATTYSPYFETELSIPDAIKNLPDYGCSVPKSDGSGDIYNYVDFENGKYNKNCAKIYLPSLDWTPFATSEIGAYAEFAIEGVGTPKRGGYEGVCSKYEISHATSTSDTADKTISISSSTWGSNKRLVIKDASFASYTTSAEVKSALAGSYLVYEIESTKLYDISSILAPIPCETGGTITLVNEHSLDVPNTICYKKEV